MEGKVRGVTGDDGGKVGGVDEGEGALLWLSA